MRNDPDCLVKLSVKRCSVLPDYLELEDWLDFLVRVLKCPVLEDVAGGLLFRCIIKVLMPKIVSCPSSGSQGSAKVIFPIIGFPR